MREYLRARSLARLLHSRLYQAPNGAIHRTSGAPDFERLYTTLATGDDRITEGSQLGFRAASEGEFSRGALHSCGRALTHWQAHLATTARRNLSRRALQAEHLEIELLRRRHSTLSRWVDLRPTGGDACRVTFLLDDSQEAALRGLLDRPCWAALPACAFRLARLVYWFRGLAVTERYLSTLADLQAAHSPQGVRAETFQRQLDLWELRAGREPRAELQRELARTLTMLPGQLRSGARLSAKAREMTFANHCAALRRRVRDWLTVERGAAIRRVCAAYACLMSCDQRRADLPFQLAVEYFRSLDFGEFRRSVRALGKQLHQRAYKRLVTAIEAPGIGLETADYAIAREVLARGASLRDLEWLRPRELFQSIVTKPYSAGWARRLDATLHSYRLPVGLDEVLDNIEQECDVRSIDEFVGWLRTVPQSALKKRLGAVIGRSLISLWLPAAKRLGCPYQLRNWARVPRELPVCGKLPTLESQRWMDRIAYYQRMSDLPPAVPKSLREQFELRERYESEVAHLQGRLQEYGNLSEPQRIRLANLQQRLTGAPGVSSKRLKRTAEELYVATAMNALRYIVLREAQTNCVRVGLDDVAAKWLLDVSCWISNMTKHERSLLAEVASVWKRHGPSYRAHLRMNRAWLQKAAAHGLQIDAWLATPAARVSVENQPFRIEICHQPEELVLMGSYVNTCLSLPDACNAHSVRANAYDANKQVLYVRNRAGHVVGRQLVAISTDFRLLGYYPYTTYADDEEPLYEGIERQLAAFCGSWARRVGLPLGNEGHPEPIADRLWYDDGINRWDKAAEESWQRAGAAVSPHSIATTAKPTNPEQEPQELVLAGGPLA